MRNLLLTLLCALFLATTNTNAQQQAQQYAIKSGYAIYNLTGNTTGTKSVYWDNYGTTTLTEIKSKTVTKMFGMKSEEEAHTITLIKEDKYWSADLLDNSGSKGTLPYYSEAKEYAESMTEKEQEELANELLSSMGGERLGNESVEGYTCEVISLMGAKSWIYKGIVLKSEAKIMGIESNEVITEFKPNTKVSSSKFMPYDGVEYTDMSQASEQYGGNPFAQMAAAMEMQDEYEEEEEEEIVPVNYSYEKFKSVTSSFSYPSYTFRGNNSFEGQHMCVFSKGISSTITIVATSRKNAEDDEDEELETFTYKGKKCHFGSLDEDDGSALLVEYPQNDMYIIIATEPEMSKQALLDMHEQLDF